MLDVQSFLCSMLPRSGICKNILHVTQCLITNMNSLMWGQMLYVLLALYQVFFLLVYNIDSLDILKIKILSCTIPLKIVLDQFIRRRIAQMHLFTCHFSWKYKTSTMIIFLFMQMVHGMGFLWLVLQFFYQTL